MKIEITGSLLDMKPTKVLLEERGLGKGGMAQTVLDSEIVRLMKPYTPMRTGALQREATFSGIGTGLLGQHQPYARHMYYGKVMVDPVTRAAGFKTKEGLWKSRRGVKKVVSNRNITYQGAPMRGAFWFERMKADHIDELLNIVAKETGGRADK